MSSPQILRIPIHDKFGENILVEVSTNGLSSLDLKLLATEGEFPYIATIKQSRVSRLRAKTSPILDAQWETILHSTLLHQRFNGEAATVLENLEVFAEIHGDQLEIAFRRNITGITQRLGAIILKKDEDQEINTVAWALNAVSRSTDLESEVRDLQIRCDEQRVTIEKLNEQLNDLIEAKKEHENSLLEKFRELLNAKKLKIRDQQRLLADAKVDSKKAAQIQSARYASKSPVRVSTFSQQNKRKLEPVSPESEDSGFEDTRVASKKSVDAADDDVGAVTPEKSHLDGTEDEAGDDDDLDAVRSSQPAPRRGEPELTGKAIESKVAEGTDETGMRKGKVLTPPPRRELPFGQKEVVREDAKMAEEAQVGTGVEGSGSGRSEGDNADEETSDDEL